MESCEFKLKTLTPVRTGDIAQNCREIKPQGIRGSLRSRYEDMVKFLGSESCNPTGGNACNLEKMKKTDKLCEVCKLFGCTGYASRFRLELYGGNPTKKGRTECIEGELSCILTFPFATDALFKEKTFACLKFVFMYSQVGGKTSKDFGELCICDNGLPTPSLESIQSIANQPFHKSDEWFLTTLRKNSQNRIKKFFVTGEKKASIIHGMIS